MNPTSAPQSVVAGEVEQAARWQAHRPVLWLATAALLVLGPMAVISSVLAGAALNQVAGEDAIWAPVTLTAVADVAVVRWVFRLRRGAKPARAAK